MTLVLATLRTNEVLKTGYTVDVEGSPVSGASIGVRVWEDYESAWETAVMEMTRLGVSIVGSTSSVINKITYVDANASLINGCLPGNIRTKEQAGVITMADSFFAVVLDEARRTNPTSAHPTVARSMDVALAIALPHVGNGPEVNFTGSIVSMKPESGVDEGVTTEVYG